MPAKIDIINKQFGRLLVLQELDIPAKSSKFYLCKCSCGNECNIRKDALMYGKTKSCGCLVKHHMSKIPEYYIWKAIIQRTTNPNDKRYKDYGGRNITVSEEWKDFKNFIRDVGFRPDPSYTIERKDNNKGYCKDNVIWTDKKSQSRNKRNNRLLEFEDQIKTLAEWAELYNIKSYTLAKRIKMGWTMNDALNKEVRKQQSKGE